MRAIGSPAVRTMIDTCAAGQAEAQPIADLIDRWLPGGEVAHIHLNDPNRRAPGQGELRFAPILAALRRQGYAGIALGRAVRLRARRSDLRRACDRLPQGPARSAGRSDEHGAARRGDRRRHRRRLDRVSPRAPRRCGHGVRSWPAGRSGDRKVVRLDQRHLGQPRTVLPPALPRHGRVAPARGRARRRARRRLARLPDLGPPGPRPRRRSRAAMPPGATTCAWSSGPRSRPSSPA